MSRPIKILFICHGNICRSPMAEFILRDMLMKEHKTHVIMADSAATSTEDLGRPIYPPARRILTQHGICCCGKTARLANKSDYEKYDLLIGMDNENIRNMRRIFGGDPDGKFRLMTDFTDHPGRQIPDPWYTDDYESTWNDIEEGCRGIMKTYCG